MLRRTFFRWISSGLLPFLFPRWAHAQSAGLTDSDLPMLQELAVIVLPGSLGRTRQLEIATRFQQWIRNYHAGADAGYGYGITRLRVLGPNPAAHYGEQLRRLKTAADTEGAPFERLSDSDKRSLVEAALSSAGVTALPPQPNGQYVATDLMSFFYNSSPGEDFLYDAAIKREDCRGLANSDKPPARLS